ncbi:alpha-hydroxy-acid oxidizing protein [Starkeya sp. 3C]|uniref:Alpha-hydroxy-acid oxidizing protein n=1 Tax=Ancylobacter moscoviensis TaxID=2597768 RepID=A0ABY3DLN3_9HYPH|nr:alpha-hydroxy acid oxidase [Ancylobacter moscoviensis]TSJ60157.1 alpha-hydroxy-acid oxidizing protein [Ancylobacter moscoviensis]
MPRLDFAASIADLRLLARARLPRSVFEFIDGGAADEYTLKANSDDFGAFRLMPDVGVDVALRSSATTVVGKPSRLPLVLAPTGLAGLYWPKGEIAAARSAARAGISFCLSTNSVASMEEVADAVPEVDRWFQLYFLKDPDLMRSMVERARASGYRVLCITLDLAVQGRRDRDIRNAFTVPLKPRLTTVLEVLARPAWLAGFLRAPMRFGNFAAAAPQGGFSSIAQHIAKLCDASADWDTVARLIELWDGPVVVKGLLNPRDAERAVALGVDAIIVSNHGGRQLDRVPSAIAALPAIAAAVAGRTQIILDGGVRRGTDIAIARCLGADACMIGRPFLWGLAAAGEAGVTRALDILRDELDIAMALLGVTSMDAFSAGHLWRNETAR